MSDRLTETAALLAKENEFRRAAIRHLAEQIATIRRERDKMLDDMLTARGDYPNRGWDQSYRHMIEQHEIRIEQLVYEIASREAGPVYYQLHPVTGPEFRSALVREMWIATADPTAVSAEAEKPSP